MHFSFASDASTRFFSFFVVPQYSGSCDSVCPCLAESCHSVSRATLFSVYVQYTDSSYTDS